MAPNLLNPARLAAVLVVVVFAAFMLVEASRHAVGYRVLLLSYDPRGCLYSGDHKIIVEVRRSDIRINQETYTTDAAFNAAIKQRLLTRAEKFVFLAADPEVSYDSVLQRVDTMRGMFPDLRVAMITPSAPRETCQWKLAASPLVPKLGERRTDHVPGEAPPLGFHEPRALATNR